MGTFNAELMRDSSLIDQKDPQMETSACIASYDNAKPGTAPLTAKLQTNLKPI